MATYSTVEIRRISQNAEALLSIFRRVDMDRWIDHTAAELDGWVGRELSRLGVVPTMVGYRGYPAHSCISPNDVAVHGIPGERPIVRGDIFTLDIAGKGGGWTADAAWTFVTPGASDRGKRTVAAAWSVLRQVACMVKGGVSVREIAECSEEAARRVGARVVPQFAGHGIGRELHEAPRIPFVTNGTSGAGGYRLEVGEVVSIEPVVTLGDGAVTCGDGGWNCRSDDGAPVAHFEVTVAVGARGCRILGFDEMEGTALPEAPPFG